jgi:TonB family protein
MNTRILVAIGLTLAFAIGAGAADPLDGARQLYLSAAYEEALASLSNVPNGADPDQVDKLRALCFLALSRREEATKALESLASRRPLLQFDESESPKLVALYRDARLRVLPPATKSLYGAAKDNYQKGELELAKQQFGDVLTLLAEPELSKLPESADLRMLAEGFARLVDQQLSRPVPPVETPAQPASVRTAGSQEGAANGSPAVASSPATTTSQTTPRPVANERTPAAAPQNPPPSAPSTSATTPPPTQPAAAPPAPAPPSAASSIFTESDRDVTPPVPIEQRLPVWVPPASLRNRSFSGFIEVVVDETGKVTTATMSKSVNGAYDALLISATRNWRYRPALRDGRPVKFRRVVSVVLSPAS